MRLIHELEQRVLDEVPHAADHPRVARIGTRLVVRRLRHQEPDYVSTGGFGSRVQEIADECQTVYEANYFEGDEGKPGFIPIALLIPIFFGIASLILQWWLDRRRNAPELADNELRYLNTISVEGEERDE